MGNYVSLISEIGLEDLAHVGGKGANLGELNRGGFTVPGGFSVKASSFEAHIKENGIGAGIKEVGSSVDFRQPEDVEEKTGRIREMITAAAIPADIASEITAAYEELGEKGASPLVAVRSSVGTRDLRRSSFPGQMDTYHNVLGCEQVLACVRECWASVWSVRAASTAHAMGIDSNEIIIAPVVQLMVPSEAAGVLFTANPITGNKDEMMINAAFGLGEAVVSGRLTPDHYVISKPTLEILYKETGSKDFKLELDHERGRGNRQVILPDEEAKRECLRPGQVEELSKLGVNIEKHYGEPQDVEWAYFKDRLFVLQSRRITGVEHETRNGAGSISEEWVSEFDTPLKDPPETYSSANISEVMPGVMTPLSLDAVKSCDYAFWKINSQMGLADEPFPEGEFDYMFIGLFYGRLHLNISLFSRLISKVPGAAAGDLDRPLSRDESFVEPESTRFSVGMIPFLIKMVFKGLLMRWRASGDLARLTALHGKSIAESRARDFSIMELEEFAGLLEERSEQGREAVIVHILNSQFATIYFGLLRNLTRRWLDDQTGALTARLVTGLSIMESAKPSFGIFRLYRLVAGSPFLKKLFQETEAHEIRARLESEQGGETEGFCSRLAVFLDEYGYRAVSEAEMMAPSWEEDPSFVFSMIQNYLKAEYVEDPLNIETRQQADRQAAMAESRRRLGLLKGRIFSRVLKDAQTFIPGRENAKALTIKGLNDLKRMVRILNLKLLDKGILQRADDIYFLSLNELIACCRGQEIDIQALVPRRKEEYERNKTVTLAETFTGRPRPIDPQEVEIPTTSVLTGLPVSPGRVTGPARVIIDPRKDARIEEGEILVAPVTDTGWTPLFLMAKGLVVDVGGLLSHGSIVAREYGIPGVLNVMVGTKVIKTGQIITVDGARGEVYLHGEN